MYLNVWTSNKVDLDITIHKGAPGRPVVIFIHGLGMNKGFWVDPVNTRVFARNIPMKVFAATEPGPCPALNKIKAPTVGNIPDTIDNLWTAVTDKGFSAVCWSQRRPSGPISEAIEELGHIVEKVKRLFPGMPLALIGHSRGGLIARKFMEKKDPAIRALITIASPHKGSSLSRLGKYLSPLKPALNRLLPADVHGTASEVLKHVIELIEGTALQELLPGSDFFINLKDSPIEGVEYLSFGGTATKLLTVYSWKKHDDKFYPSPLLIIPDSLIKILPGSIIPTEITSGRGDFLVTAESAVLPWSQQHCDLPANHITIVWHKKTISGTIGALEKL